MTTQTSDAHEGSLSRTIRVVEEQLLGMTTELLELQQRVRAGEVEALKDSAKLTGEIRHWLKMALDTEQRCEERRKEQQGIVNDYAIDFDRARTEIGCRLARLRAARCPARVSRWSDD
ncbi:hypothetical protein M8756_01795 [Lutimaribacter sp. EGI FJ00015]|uniref:Uncharacterized protein n=1 Tax=Lutimaribacter degradans TaxID=2945989 RepID=A0ACC5ZSG7_9RHOB|nr:hypothetical protein [Lutimaribacter sp. EGI FJ00013]MCM2561027.1 hypothetical protein [Lutimaribacter sp. EGI FJ00013]MCO0612026.1 hypothetical protein [Lutimaribacter sp. EGI FJ00015]MCO0634854.1 hypothetical protein [Lutimaribacter sp. EGI FJ00014]